MKEIHWKTTHPREVKTAEFHSLMLAAIGPRPIAFVSTVDEEGRPNLAPFSFFNAFGSNPPTLIFSPARRGRDGSTKHTLHNVEKTGECVVNVVNFNMVEQMSLASCEFDEGVNEFIKAGFTPVSSELVKAPRVGESPAALECKVVQIIKTGEFGGAGNLVICDVVAMHYQQDVLLPDGKVDQLKMDLVGRMGYEFYCRANKDSIFEVPKPTLKEVIGFDGLPREIRESEWLTGNELARLANWPAIPFGFDRDEFMTQINRPPDSKEGWITLGKAYLSAMSIDAAWKCFLISTGNDK